MTIRVLLADDQALLRQTFRILLSATPDMDVVGEAADGREAAELARTHHPDVVVMDIRMPGTDGPRPAPAMTQDRSAARSGFPSVRGRRSCTPDPRSPYYGDLLPPIRITFPPKAA
ncbi:response regulator [Actinoallomurus purpureus]|uniref:response regulator n=1 Tax=Actinoallomurus purpureus TaxID=478114 RepID=UPI0025B01AF6|nr:response regulator transcription factor [Actinoallomurus purpureus]